MSQSEKSQYYGALKAAGQTFEKHYREYNTEELKTAYEAMIRERPELAITRETKPSPGPSALASLDREELPGERLNSQPEDEPIEVDENGLIWYQKEVRKPAYAKPRGRRVLTYVDNGAQTKVIQDAAGGFVESFEISGNGQARQAEVKVTLPSYQVGIYKDPRLPFKVHIYNSDRGFDLEEVEAFYGGADLLPAGVKRKYVENVLCYDIRSVVQAIEAEYRQLQLNAGRA